MIGAELGVYRIVAELGVGGMGVVYKAVDTSLDRMVAVKVLSSEFSRNPELVQRFRAEARAQANLNHTNIATLYAFLAQGDQAWMVMEYIEGETISHMLERRGLLPPDLAVPLFKQALLGIGWAHRMGIVHRDIKPNNLMVNQQGIVKVMDFGIAKVMGSNRGLTRTGTQMGTTFYMSPEQVMNKPLDHRSDIYSLGVTLYEMLTANLPFQGESDFQIMNQHVNAQPPLPSRYYPYIPKGTENAVMKALAKDPGARFQTVEEFGAALERPQDFGTSSSPSISLGPPPPPVRSTPPPMPPPPQRTTPPPLTAADQPTLPEGTGAPATTPQIWPLAGSPPTMPPPPPPVAQAPAPKRLSAMLATREGKIIAAAAAVLLLLAIGLLSQSGRGNVKISEVPRTSTDTPPPTAPKQNQEVTVWPPAPAPGDSGNGGGNGDAATDLKVVQFGATVKRVAPGQTSRLNWTVRGAAQVTITPSIGAVEATGSKDVVVQRTTEFVLTARKVDGTEVHETVVVEVAPNSPTPPTPPPKAPQLQVSFEVRPDSMIAGQSAMLRWSVPGADAVAIMPGIGRVPASGSMPVRPAQTTTYSLAARAGNGPVATGEVTVTVSQPVKEPVRPEVTLFDAMPRVIQAGASTTLRWSLRNAVALTIAPAPGKLTQTTGQYMVAPETTTTYVLTAYSQDGTTATAQAVVQVIARQATPPPPQPPPQPPPPVTQRSSAMIAVVHDHGGALATGVWPGCYGVLQVVNGMLRFNVGGATDGRRDNFEVPVNQVGEIRLNRMRIRNQPAFHIVVRGQHLNFVTTGMAAAQAVSQLEAAVSAK